MGNEVDTKQVGSAAASRVRHGDMLRSGLSDKLSDPLSKKPAVQAAGGAIAGGGIPSVATAGFSGSSAPLPYRDVIQSSFGKHDISGVQAHTGPEARAATSAMGTTAFASGNNVALATNDSGALVTVSINQTEKVTPNDGGTVGFEPGPGRALSGFDEKSAKGVQRVVGLQLMFYVPAVGADEKIRLLGWSESLIGASEVP